MGFGDITDPEAILSAVKESEEIGEKAFLEKHGFGPAGVYFLVVDGKEYPSKAILGVAHKFQFPDKGPLSSNEFSGGKITVKRKLTSLGFEVRAPENAD